MSLTLEPELVAAPALRSSAQDPGAAPPCWLARDWAYLAALSLLALAARCLHLAREPLWLDEVFTYQRIHLHSAALIADSFANRHMPNYFLLLQWLTPADGDPAALRLPSALFGAASVGVVFAIGRQLAGRFGAAMGALLVALAPTQVQYGQEARSYTLMLLLIAVALWGVVWLVRHPRRAAVPLWRGDGARVAWTACVAGTVGALDVLGDALPWLVAANLVLGLVALELRQDATRQEYDGFLRNWGWSQSLIALCCAPFYLAILLASDGRLMQNFGWVPPLSWHGLWVIVASIYLMRPAAVLHLGLLPTTAMSGLAPAVLLLGGLGLYRLRGRVEGRALGLALASLPVLLLGVSLAHSLLVPRYALWGALPFFVLAGIGADAVPARLRPVVLGALLLVGAMNLLPVYRVETKARWDRAAALLASQVRPGDTVYTADPNGPAMLRALQPAGAVPIGDRALVTSRLDVALERWRHGSRVWAVNGRSAMGRRERRGDFQARLARLGRPARAAPLGREITVLLYPAPGPPR